MNTFNKNGKTIARISDQYREKGDYIGAISVLLNDKVYSKKDWFIYYKLGKLYLEIEDYKNAEFYFLKYAQSENKNEKCLGYNGLAITCIKSGRENLALKIFDEQWNVKARKECPYNEEIFELFSSVDESEKGVSVFKPIFKPDKNEEYFGIGRLYYDMNDYNNALKSFKKNRSEK